MIEVGIIEDSFDLFHLKHVEYILTAKMRCKKLLIGITDPDKKFPFTYYEKLNMICESLKEFGIKREEYEVVPFPIHDPEKILLFVPQDATVFMSIYNEKSKEQKKILEDLKLNTKVLWENDKETQGMVEEELKSRILKGEEWESGVPKAVYKYALKHDIKERLTK